jgi:hypothetical protein
MAIAATVLFRGSGAAEVAKATGMRLIESGRAAEQLTPDVVDKLGGPAGAAHACRLLSRNAVFVMCTDDRVTPEGEVVAVDLDPNDTPEFAAEKALEMLQEIGLFSSASGDYSPDEEEEIRKRLSDLGYIE